MITKIIRKQFSLVSAPGLLPESPARENNSTGAYFGKSPFPVRAPFPEGAKAGLLPDPENNSAKIYLGNSPKMLLPGFFGKSPEKIIRK